MEVLGLGVGLLALFVSFGFMVGVFFGFFGMGGSFLVTPALLVMGYPARVAIGSGMAFVFGTAVIATMKHHGLGQVDYKLGGLMFVGLSVGIEGGRALVFYLETLGKAELVVGSTYVLLLGGIGLLFTRNALRDEEDTDETEDVDHDVDPDAIPEIAKTIQSYHVPPMVTLSGGIRVSLWTIFAVALAVGLVSGFLGIGGGFIRLPAIFYLIGLPLPVAVGTNLFGGLISGGVGSFLYAQSGGIDLSIVVPMLVGSALGARIGSTATMLVDDEELKIYFGLLLLVASVAVALSELGTIFAIAVLETISFALILVSALVVCVIVLYTSVVAIRGRDGTAIASGD